MKILTALLFLLLFVTHIFAGQQRLHSIRCQKGEVVFEISSDRVRSLPNTGWRPESDLPPPVTLKEACLLAKQSLKARLPEWDAFEVQYVELQRIATAPDKQHHWFYIVACGGQKNGLPSPSNPQECDPTAVILMDGTSVDPIVKSQR